MNTGIEREGETRVGVCVCVRESEKERASGRKTLGKKRENQKEL